MRVKAAWLFGLSITIALLVGGCAGAAPAQDTGQLAAAQSQVASLQAQADKLSKEVDQSNKDLQAAAADKTKLQGQLSAAQAQASQLQDQLNKAKTDKQLVGSTPAETAQKIVKFYHDTHVYSTYDLFVCTDMAIDVWNMLQAQNIKAKLQVGRIDTPAKEIVEVNHAWVLAEVSPGTYLALETTAGYAVTKDKNPLYYQGWSFQSPKDHRAYIDLLNEYNFRVAIVNDMITRQKQLGDELNQANASYSQMVNTFNSQYAGKPVSADSKAYQDKMTAQMAVVQEKQGRFNQEKEESNKQNALLPPLLVKMKALVSG